MLSPKEAGTYEGTKLALRVYACLSASGKAACNAVGEILHMLAMVAVSMLVWHKIQTGDTITGMVIAAFILIDIIKTGNTKYRQEIGNQPTVPARKSRVAKRDLSLRLCRLRGRE